MSQPSSQRGVTVLGVDDDPMSLLVLDRVFGRLGAKLIHSRSGSGVPQLVTSYRPHLIVVDVRMPEIEGPTLIKQLRTSETRHQTSPVIILYSALSDAELSMLARHCGADGFIRKGIPVLALEEELRSRLAEAAMRFRGIEL